MIKFFADCIEQLDMAVDHLSIGDANNARIAIMLIDNVLELTLHRYAKDCKRHNDRMQQYGLQKFDIKKTSAATGRHFDAKVRFAKQNGFLSDNEASTAMIGHHFRNENYHIGLQHKPILHALSLFYLKTTCDILIKFPNAYVSWCSSDIVPHRAQKYMTSNSVVRTQEHLFEPFKQMKRVAENIQSNFLDTLTQHLKKTVNSVDHDIRFLTEDSPDKPTRSEAIKSAQIWSIAFEKEGKDFAQLNKCPAKTIGEYIKWLEENYPCAVKSDPCKRWMQRIQKLANEKCAHTALKKYHDFMTQTEKFREQITEASFQLDGYIQEQIDLARGK